jgi:hypothetical protein
MKKTTIIKLLIGVVVTLIGCLLVLGKELIKTEKLISNYESNAKFADMFYEPGLLIFPVTDSIQIGQELEILVAPVWGPRFGSSPPTYTEMPDKITVSANRENYYHLYRYSADSLNNLGKNHGSAVVTIGGELEDHRGVRRIISRELRINSENGMVYWDDLPEANWRLMGD